MEILVKFLQNNPLIILVMFIISALSGTISIVFGWKRFRDDILLRKITIPVYAYLMIFFLVAVVVVFWPAMNIGPDDFGQ